MVSLDEELFNDEDHHTNGELRNYPVHYYEMSDEELFMMGLYREGKRGNKIVPMGSRKRSELEETLDVDEEFLVEKPVAPKVKKPKKVPGVVDVDSEEALSEELARHEGLKKETINFLELSGFQAKQIEAHLQAMRYKYVLYGGAAGGGKSYFLRWQAVFMCMYYFQVYGAKGVRVGLFCEDYPALKERQISKVEFEFPSWLGTLNRSESEFRLHAAFGGGVIAFRNLDDPSKYLSSEFASIFIDELTKDKEEVFHFLVLLRLRWPGIPKHDTKFIAGSNPGGPGHGWVKKLWIDRNFEGMDKVDPREFCYIQALYSDNKFIDPGYGDQLSMLPDDLAKAYRDGNWDVFAGQYFTEFNRDVHVIDDFEDDATKKIFNELPVFIGLDYGYTAPSAVVFGRFWDGEWYIFDEIYVKTHTYEELRDAILNKIHDQDMKVEAVFADPAIWAKKDSPTSGADKMRPLPMLKAPNDRIIGWTVVRQFFKTNAIKINRRCVHLVSTIPNQVHSERRIDDLDTNGEDHAVDALRYLLLSYKNRVHQDSPLTYLGGSVDSESDLESLFDTDDDEFTTLDGMGFFYTT